MPDDLRPDRPSARAIYRNLDDYREACRVLDAPGQTMSARWDAIIVRDAYLQHAPEDVATLLAELAAADAEIDQRRREARPENRMMRPAERAAENDRLTLTAVFRTEIAPRVGETAAQAFAKMLGTLRARILDGWGSVDAQFPQQVLADHGPAVILRALADAYEHPEPVLGELEGD